MDEMQLAIAAAIFVTVLVIALLAVFARSKSTAEPVAVEAPRAAQVGGNRAARRANRLGEGVRRRRALAAQNQADADEGSGDDEADVEDEGEGGGRVRRRDAVRAAREQEREAFAQRAQKKNAYEERRAAREAEREERERAAEEAAAKAEAERIAREDAEAAQWMGQISLEQEGMEAEAGSQGEGLLQAFVDYITTRKTVVLDELAAEFGLRIQDVITRVQSLEEMGRISGVMDDRGKFIYISREEMAALADFIHSRGRVAISELALRSNDFIDLEAKEVATSRADTLGLDLDLDDLVDTAAPAAAAAVSVGA